MKLAGTIVKELKRENGLVYCAMGMLRADKGYADFFIKSQKDDDMAVADITYAITHEPEYTVFVALPYLEASVGDEFEFLCEVEPVYGHYFVLPSYKILECTHTSLHYHWAVKDFIDVVKDVAINSKS